jgi:hypothetical protein
VSRRTATIVAWTLVAVSAILGLVGAAMELAVDGIPAGFFADEGIAVVVVVVSSIVGGLVASRLPSNPIGWIFLGMVLALSLSGLTDAYMALAEDDQLPDGPAAWAAWYSAKVFVAFFTAIFLTVLLFPDGRLPARRWKVVLWTGIAGLLLFTAAAAVAPGELDEYPGYTNPIGVDVPGRAWVFGLGFALFAAGLVGSAVSLVLRFRRSRGVERQQLTVLMGAGVAATALFVVGAAVETFLGSESLRVLTLVGILLIPVAIGVAMLRYRLYEVDRVISRTLVYGALTVILGAAYAGLVLAGQALFASFAGGSDLAIAASTLVVAALFLPLRSRVQWFVDRRFYRRRYNVQRTLEAFGARLREQIDLETLQTDLRAVVEDTMQPEHAAVWLRARAKT